LARGTSGIQSILPPRRYSKASETPRANTFTDELPTQLWKKPVSRTFWRSSRFYEITRTIADQAENAWWDDKTTPDVETRQDIFNKSFSQAVNELNDTLGRDPAKWRWGDLHAATFENATLGKSGIGPIEALFNRGPFPTGGGSSIVNATGWNPNEGFHVDWLPSMHDRLGICETRSPSIPPANRDMPSTLTMTTCLRFGLPGSTTRCCGTSRQLLATPRDICAWCLMEGNESLFPE
jgi:hypothetical protein